MDVSARQLSLLCEKAKSLTPNPQNKKNIYRQDRGPDKPQLLTPAYKLLKLIKNRDWTGIEIIQYL